MDRINFSIKAGQTISLVGESGCGKSVTASSIMRILPHPYGEIRKGRILFEGRNLLDLPIEEMYQIRGSSIAMIFQEPMTALNPVHMVKKQVGEVLELHRPDITKEEMPAHILKYLKDVEIPSAEQRLNNYPFQLSGGMRQRAALLRTYLASNGAALLDEPFSALDAITKSNIHAWYLDVMQKIDMSTLFITHDVDEAVLLSDRIYILKGKPATITDEIIIDKDLKSRGGFEVSEEFLKYKRIVLEKLKP